VTALLAALSGPYPKAFCAATVNVYSTPFVRPVIVIGDDEPVAVMLPGVDVTRYPVIALPPMSDGAVKETDACVSPAVAETEVGAPGVVSGQLLLAFACICCVVVHIPEYCVIANP
jgi:hypothetical protein